MKIKNYKRKIVFNDVENNKINLDIEIKDSKFSISGDCGSSSGQCYDSIEPTETQKEIIGLWKKYHLNDMNAGTIEQEKALEGKGNIDYDEQIKILKSKNLYEVKLENGKMYKYGTEWLTRELPTDIIEMVENTCNNIEAEQLEKKKKLSGGSWDGLDKEIIALGKFLEMTPNEAKESIEKSNYGDINYTAEGIDYYVGSEDEIEKKCKEYLIDDDDMWKQAVESGNTTDGLEDWAEDVIRMDGYGHILNGWDGTEHYDSEMEMYVIRQ